MSSEVFIEPSHSRVLSAINLPLATDDSIIVKTYCNYWYFDQTSYTIIYVHITVVVMWLLGLRREAAELRYPMALQYPSGYCSQEGGWRLTGGLVHGRARGKGFSS